MKTAVSLSALAASARAQFHPVPVPTQGQLVGETSSKAGATWSINAPLAWGADFPSTLSLTIDRSAKAQTMLGFGSAFTDTAAWNFMHMNESIQAAYLESTFGQTGAQWTLGRVTINSADYSFQTYAYDNTPDDFSLANFDHNLTYDGVNVQPFIRAAQAVARKRSADIKLFGSPWSPPGWMKTNGQQNSCSSPNSMKADTANGSYLQAWADYISAWLSSYASKGMPMYAITPQNEPNQFNGGGCCMYDPGNYTAWLTRYLGPTVRKDHPDVDIWVWDYNKGGEFIPTMQALAAEPAAAQYIDGIALHWYDYEGTLGLDAVAAAQALVGAQAGHAGVITVATEACYLQSLTESWNTGAELVTIDALGDIAFNTSGWTFWNAVLHTGYPSNYQGGPQHGGGDGLSGPIFFNQAQDGSQTLVYQSSFWGMGQLSRYVPPGSVRVSAAGPGFASTIADYEAVRATIVNNAPPPAGGLPLVAAAFEDAASGACSVVILNAGAADMTFKLSDAGLPAGSAAVSVTVAANSIVSYKYLVH